ncbi:hypothetical protein CLC19222_01503 [Campylobacter lari subsp. concheus]
MIGKLISLVRLSNLISSNLIYQFHNLFVFCGIYNIKSQLNFYYKNFLYNYKNILGEKQ